MPSGGKRVRSSQGAGNVTWSGERVRCSADLPKLSGDLVVRVLDELATHPRFSLLDSGSPDVEVEMSERRKQRMDKAFRAHLGDAEHVWGAVLHDGRLQHWVALAVTYKKAPRTADAAFHIAYFDSFGRPPARMVAKYIVHVTHVLCDVRDSHSTPIAIESSFNQVRYQHDQTECGIWALLFLRQHVADIAQPALPSPTKERQTLLHRKKLRRLIFEGSGGQDGR